MPDFFYLSNNVLAHNDFEAKMKACLYAAEKHGIALGQVIENREGLINTAARILPEHSVTTDIKADCFMIKQSVIDLFGLPDIEGGEISKSLAQYWQHINNFGFSAVVAHHALYSYRDGHISGITQDLDDNPVLRFLPLFDDEYYPKKRILFECAYMPQMHCGTVEVMINSFESFCRLFGGIYDVFLYTSREAAEYHGLAGRHSNILFPDTIKGVFHLGYIPNQAMWYKDQVLVNRHCLKVVQNMLDIMMIRTIRHLPIDVSNNVDLSISLCDGITFISKFSEDDFLAYYAHKYRAKHIPETKVIYIAKGPADTSGFDKTGDALPFSEFILISGGLYKHKAVKEAAAAVVHLNENFIVIGMEDTGFTQNNVYCYKGGHLDDGLINLLYMRCKAVIFPSLYEGFGLPVVMSLICGKYIIVYDNSVNRELQNRYPEHKDSFLFFKSFDEIPKIIENTGFNYQLSVTDSQLINDSWDRAAQDMEAFFAGILSSETDIYKLEKRSWVYKQIEARSRDVLRESSGTIAGLTARINELEYQASAAQHSALRLSGSGFISILRYIIKENIKRRHPRLFRRLKGLRRKGQVQPKVSVLIPNKDNSPVLRNCIESILKHNTYKNFEIIVLENNSIDDDTFAFYEELEKNPYIRVVRYPENGFNFQKIINFGVKSSDADYIVLLNNDTILLTPCWLEFMLEAAAQENTGAVGAVLYYPDMSTQFTGGMLHMHGDILVCSHMFKGMTKEHRRHMWPHSQTYNTAWVTGACLMVRKSTFELAGGMDEDFEVTFGDVDLCMKFREMGLINVIHPYVELIHDECTTRGFDEASEEKMEKFLLEQKHFLSKWRNFI